MDPVDVVACFYRDTDCTTRFWEGIQANRALIARVILVNDEPWSIAPNLPGAPEVIYLDHPHAGYGVARSLNQGIREADTDDVLLIGYDYVLPEGFLERRLSLAGPERLSGGFRCGSTPPDLSLLRACDRNWRAVSGHLLVNRAAHALMGGFDEAFCGSYGYEDFEYAARWQQQFGPENVLYSLEPAEHLHVATDAVISEANALRLLATLRGLHGPRLALFSDFFPQVPPIDFVWVAQPSAAPRGPFDLAYPLAEPTALAALGPWECIQTVVPSPVLRTQEAVATHLQTLCGLSRDVQVFTYNPTAFARAFPAWSGGFGGWFTSP